MNRCLVIPLLLILSLAMSGQKRSALKLYTLAQQQIDSDEAKAFLIKAIDKDITYTDAYLSLSDLYSRCGEYDQQVNTLIEADANCADRHDLILVRLAKAAYLNGAYHLASDAINQLDIDDDSQLLQLKSQIGFSIEAVAHPLAFDAVNMGSAVNTKYHDYWPSLSIDGRKIVTTVLVDHGEDDLSSPKQEDLYMSSRVAGAWSESAAMTSIINTSNNEGAQCLSADGNMMFFTACDRYDGVGSCDIYYTHKSNNMWSSPRPLPEPLNSKSWDGHPSLSADEHYLYFSSTRAGGQGGYDLYVATLEFGHSITVVEVRNLGQSINTPQDELSPFIHPDGKSLYFSSDGHLGLGRQDIFYAQQDSTGFTHEPINIGYPINTHNDEIGLVLSAKGDKGYFASDRTDSRKNDIYTFDIPVEARPNEVTYLAATISDEISQQALVADVELTQMSTGELIYSTKAVSEFTIPLPLGDDYAINVSCPSYLFYSENFSLQKDVVRPFHKNIMLSRMESGNTLVLKNVLFAHDSSELDTSFTAELDKVLTLIQLNPDVQFEISGHTDSVGSSAYNMQLSEQRAKAVCDYLIANGVSPDVLQYKGYGDTRPISELNNENRRTELLIK